MRRAFGSVDEAAGAAWQRRHLRRCYEPLLYEPWILDIDTTVKVLYGHQQGAKVGYNPHKPGRPSHVDHTYFIANLRLVLDVEVQPGNRRRGASGARRVTRVRGCSPFSTVFCARRGRRFSAATSGLATRGRCRRLLAVAAERRAAHYLFKLRQTKKVARLIEEVFGRADWADAGQGWQGVEDTLKLSGWSRTRRVIVLRRECRLQAVGRDALVLERQRDAGQLEMAFIETLDPVKKYEYAAYVTSLDDAILTVAQHYRDRGDAENPFDELKNQWGWAGYTTCDLKRCQIMAPSVARHIALIYNWWSLFARLAIPDKHAEAITSRPLLLHAVGKQTRHAGQTRLTITSMHGKASRIRKILSYLTAFLRAIRRTAEQLDWSERWRIILSRIFIQFLRGRLLKTPKLIGCDP